ncbi:serine hydrolase [Brevundimonas sp. AAP58]|uniref:serine hydrolase domain-containing protein n=1 Tax=Brevundimonas sp. AAP58 TaxID=1523422 RepID=UPI0006B908B4|nr:serine hydrolase domain-containing protein [Brevundimonas sp. AAP58]
MRPALTAVLAACVALAPLAAAARAGPASAVATPQATAADAAAFDRATATVLERMRVVAATPGAAPAMAVVMVRRGQPPVIWTHGHLSTEAGAAPADADTPFYIASQTKAFMGLLAVRLDAEGMFDLDQTLAEVWPDLTLPAPADPAVITFRDLLSHQGPFETPALSYRTAYVDLVPAADYGRLMAEGSQGREPGFRYSNLGYLVYSAALELTTGRDWRDWLDQALFQPAGMTRSGARASRFDGIPLYHRWMGERGWDAFEGKPDDLMHAAGGLVMSPNDMARWLSIQLGEAAGGLDPAWVRETQSLAVAADIRGDGVPCQGYGLGWNLCRIGAVDVRAHGGGYTGMRSAMAVSPDLGVGFAFFSNSDSLTGGLGQMMVQTFFETVQSAEPPAMTLETFGQQYGERLARFAAQRMQAVEARRAEAQWAGWTWRPSPADRAAYVGTYRHATLGDLAVVTQGEAVQARMGVVTRPLEPAAPDLFGITDGLADPPSPVRFERADGRVTAVVWDAERFERLP